MLGRSGQEFNLEGIPVSFQGFGYLSIDLLSQGQLSFHDHGLLFPHHSFGFGVALLEMLLVDLFYALDPTTFPGGSELEGTIRVAVLGSYRLEGGALINFLPHQGQLKRGNAVD